MKPPLLSVSVSGGSVHSKDSDTLLIIRSLDYGTFRGYLYKNGEIDEDEPDAFNLYDDAFTIQSVVKEGIKRKEETGYRCSDEFEEYLSIAETLAQYENDVSYNESITGSDLTCTSPRPAKNYDRQDKTAYTFTIVGDYDEKQYKDGSKIDLLLDEDSKESATIVEIDKTDITILFDKQVNFSSISSIIRIRPSYSDVVFKIQKKVIDEIRKGELNSELLDRCVGQHSPKPIKNEALNALRRLSFFRSGAKQCCE